MGVEQIQFGHLPPVELPIEDVEVAHHVTHRLRRCDAAWRAVGGAVDVTLRGGR